MIEKTTEKSSKEKILHIVEAFGGGVYTFLVPLANSTCEEFDVTIAYGLRPQTPEAFQQELDPRIKLVKGRYFKRSLNPLTDLKSFFEIRSIVKQTQPDIIHLHSSKSGFFGRLAIDCRKYRVFYSPHGYAFLKKDDSFLNRFIYYAMEKLAAFSHCTTIGVSKSEGDIALKLSKHSTYISNGITLYNGTSHPKPIDLKNPIICTVGRICYQKDPDLFNDIAKTFPNLRFLWIGDGEMRNVLTSSNITVTGWISRNEAMDYLKTASIFLLPSRWEGLPISLLEAMYEGKICIANPVTGTCDVIHNRENGFHAANLQDYIKIINGIINNKYNTEKIITNAFQDILTTYNINIMTQKYAELYKKGLVQNENSAY